jgi:hypothetical protein
MSASVPLDDLPRDLESLCALIDELGEEINALSDRRDTIATRISDIENGVDEWTAHQECVSGERRIW